jgi:DNA-binding NtrC family response regulator
MRVLVIDDDPLMREYVEEAMIRCGHTVDTAANGSAGIALFEARGHDVVITDLKMAPMDGIEVVRRAVAINPETPILVMTAYGTIETAIAALKEGAVDYLMKPFPPDVLDLAITRAVERSCLKRENRYLRAEIAAQHDYRALIGESAAMRFVHEQIRKVADSRATVLVRGETGTGKELVAHALHHVGPRADKPFVKVNCAALSAGILESELFGHEKGAFTGAHERKTGRFELADGGSLLLDEISEVPIDLQAKLLRALQEREFERVGGMQTIRVDARIIATSNRDLEQAVEKGRFREDLFFRLNVITILLPPLRQRREDIPLLLDHFLKRVNQENGRRVKGFSEAAHRLLVNYDWPGNVRELQNAVERAVILTSSEQLEARDFPLSPALAASASSAASSFRAGMTVAEMEKQLIFQTLEHCGQNRTRAAEVLDISVRTLRNKLKEYGAAEDTGDEE